MYYYLASKIDSNEVCLQERSDVTPLKAQILL